MAKRILSALIPCSFLLITFSASAAIPVRWTVDTFRVKPLVYECYHGETLDIAAAMTAYGEPLDLHGKTAKLYWQTNGMDSAYWSTNATITTSQTSQTPQTSQTTNVLQATFVGSFDPGAPSVSGFIGVEGENYRASFTLNFRPSPGFTPAHISPPVKVLDFATTQVANPEASPFMVKGGAGVIDAATAGTIATNTVDAKVAPWAMNGQPKPSGGADTNAVNDLIRTYDTTNLTARIASKQDKLPYATNAIPATAIADAPWLTASATNGLRRVEDMNAYTNSANWVFIGKLNEGYIVSEPVFSPVLGWYADVTGEASYIVSFGNYDYAATSLEDNSYYGHIVFKRGIFDVGRLASENAAYTIASNVVNDTILSSAFASNVSAVVTSDVAVAFSPWSVGSTMWVGAFIYSNAAVRANGDSWQIHVFQKYHSDTHFDDYGWMNAYKSDMFTPADKDDVYIVAAEGAIFNRRIVAESTRSPTKFVNALGLEYRQDADAKFAPKLSGRTYDFDHGSNFTKRVYAALTNVIQALGGTVANPPTFN